MAKITALDVAEALSGDEHLPIVQNGTTRRATMAGLRDLITPFLQNWYKGDRGETGGNVMSVGTFAQMAARSNMVHSGTTRIKLADRLGVEFVYDATVDADYVAANPNSAFLTRTEQGATRGFVLAPVDIHVEQLGAVPYPLGADSTAAIRDAIVIAAAKGGRVVGTRGKQYAVNGGGLGTWFTGVKFGDLGIRRSGVITAALLSILTAGVFDADGLTIEEATDHSSQFASIEVDHARAELNFTRIRAWKGYSGLWIKQCARASVSYSDFGYSSHPIYLGRNDVTGLGATYGYVDNVSIYNCRGHHAKVGGDGLKTVSRVRFLDVVEGEYHDNAQDGIDLFAGCMKARFSRVKLYDNKFQHFDIKVGDSAGGVANYPEVDWGERRDILIDACIMDRAGYNAVKVFGDDVNGYYKRVTVTKCQIDFSGGHGIVMRGLGCIIDGNTVRRSGQNPATAELAGISVQYDSPTISSLRVVLNIVIDNGRPDAPGSAGMLFTNCSGAHISGNVTGNQDTTNQRIDYFFNGGTGNYLAHATFLGPVANPVICSQAGNIIFGENCGLPVRKVQTLTIPVGSQSVQVAHGLCCRPLALDHVRVEYLGDPQNTKAVFPGATSPTQVTALTNAAVTGAAVSIRVTVDLRGEPNPYPFSYTVSA
jgi:hypothetical protein